MFKVFVRTENIDEIVCVELCVPILCKVIPPSRVGSVVFAGLLLLAQSSVFFTFISRSL
jgi:hypothetical protein